MKINLDKRILANKDFLIDVNNAKCIHKTTDHLKLTSRERTVLRLKYIYGLPMVDIVDKLPRVKKFMYRSFIYNGAISKQMASLIHKRALSKIKKTFKSN